MKISSVLFALSLAANVGLLLLLRPAPDPAPAFDALRSHSTSTPPAVRGTMPAGERNPESTRNTPTSTTGDGSTWRQLSSDNLAIFVARLRAAGFPPHQVHAIIRHAIDERHLAQREELLASAGHAPFWRPPPRSLSPETATALSRLERERDRSLRQLLGDDADLGDELQPVYLRRQYGNLAPEKLRRLQDLLDDYGELHTEFEPPNRAATAADRRKLALIEQELRKDLSQLLSPKELEEYDLRNSPLARELRQQLAPFHPSEEEYRAIFQLSRAMEEHAPPAAGPLTAQQRTARRALEQQVQARLKETLGPERYADYQQATNPSYTALNQLVNRFDLPVSAAREVVMVQRDLTARANAIRASKETPVDQKPALLAALSQEAAVKLGATLTERGLAAYQQRGGAWLHTLASPRPDPAR